MSRINWKLIQNTRMSGPCESDVILMFFSSFQGLTPAQSKERLQVMENHIKSALEDWAAVNHHHHDREHDKEHEEVIRGWLQKFAGLPGGKQRLSRMKPWADGKVTKTAADAVWPKDV